MRVRGTFWRDPDESLRSVDPKLVRRGWQFVRPYRAALLLYLAATTMSSLLQIAPALLIRQIVDQALPHRDSRSLGFLIDSETEALVQQALAEVMRGGTSFVIAHRLSTVRAADQILVPGSGQRRVSRRTQRIAPDPGPPAAASGRPARGPRANRRTGRAC